MNSIKAFGLGLVFAGFLIVLLGMINSIQMAGLIDTWPLDLQW